MKWKDIGGLILPDLSILTTGSLNHNEDCEQCLHEQSSKTDPHKYYHLIFDKGKMTIQWRTAPSTTGEKLAIHMEKSEPGPKLLILNKFNTK